MDKSEKERLKKEFQNNEKINFEGSLPMPREMFKKLFNYLDKQSEKRECKHNLKLTIEFLKKHNIPEGPILKWLEEIMTERKEKFIEKPEDTNIFCVK